MRALTGRDQFDAEAFVQLIEESGRQDHRRDVEIAARE